MYFVMLTFFNLSGFYVDVLKLCIYNPVYHLFLIIHRKLVANSNILVMKKYHVLL